MATNNQFLRMPPLESGRNFAKCKSFRDPRGDRHADPFISARLTYA